MATSSPGVTGGSEAQDAASAKNRRKARRRASGALVITAGLVGAGALGWALIPEDQTATAAREAQPDFRSEASLDEGKALYEVSCVTCHGVNLQGVEGQGPSLVGVGEGATYFQVHTGRMPMVRNEAQAKRKMPRYSTEQTLAIAAYVGSFGGGSQLVLDKDGEVAQETLRGANYEDNGNKTDPADVARGSELFRLNCASCHNFTGRGGALSSGKFAPNLDRSTEQDLYQAMLSGPQNMPRFSDRQLSPDEKKDIIAYIKSSGETTGPSGYGLGGFGPVTEGMAAWIVGLAALCGAALWIGARS